MHDGDAAAPAPEEVIGHESEKMKGDTDAEKEGTAARGEAGAGTCGEPAPDYPLPALVADPADEHRTDPPPSEAERMLTAMCEQLPPGYIYFRGDNLINYPVGAVFLSLCGPIRVAAMLRDIGGNDWSYEVEFLDRDGALRRQLIPAAALQERPRRVAADLVNSGLRLMTRPAELVRLLHHWQTPERIWTTRRTGWTEIEDRRAFVLPSGNVLTHPETSTPTVRYTGAAPSTRKAGTLAGWQNGIGRLAPGNPSLMMAISAALAPPLLRLAQIDALGINCYASTSSGKTTLMRAALSCGQDPSRMHRWNATNTAIEILAASSHDGLLVLDEFPATPDRSIVDAIYAIGNGTGRARGTHDITLRDSDRWRLVTLSTSELPIPEHCARGRLDYPEGLAVRLIDVPVRSWTHGAFAELHGHADGHAFAVAINAAAQENHGHLLEAFVALVLQHEHAMTNMMNAYLTTFRAGSLRVLGLEASTAHGPVMRVLDGIGVMVAAGSLAARAGLVPWPRGAVHAAGLEIAQLWHAGRVQRTGGPGAAIERLRAMIEDGRFVDLDDPTPPADPPAGWMDGRFIYLDSAVFADEIASDAAPGRVLDQLLEAKLLVPGGEQRSLQYKLPASVIASRPRVYRFRREGLAQA